MACTDVTFRYGKRDILRALSFEIGHGVVGVLGPNGAGKTTLLNLLTTLTEPDQGQVLLFGRDVSNPADRRASRRRIGVLPQRFSFVGSMTVEDTVRYAAWVNGLNPQDCTQAANRALETVDLVEYGRQRVRRLSGGQRQRLGIATAIAHSPELLILDEPTAGLDPLIRAQLRQSLRTLARNRTIILSTHLVEDVLHLANQILILDKGLLRYFGTPEDLATAAPDPVEPDELTSPLEAGYAELLARHADVTKWRRDAL